jgi:hypothetical protein
MPFTTNTELKAAVADQLARTDLTTQIIDFIALFECEAARELFRMRPTETSTTLTPASGSVALPSDYMGWRRVTWTGSPRVDLTYVHPTILQAYYPSTPASTPIHFTIEGTTLKIRPTSTTGLEFDYFAKLGALASALNWLMTSHSDCYFFGALEQAYLFTKDYEQAGVWSAKKQSVYDSIKMLRFREDGALAIRTMEATP